MKSRPGVCLLCGGPLPERRWWQVVLPPPVCKGRHRDPSRWSVWLR